LGSNQNHLIQLIYLKESSPHPSKKMAITYPIKIYHTDAEIMKMIKQIPNGVSFCYEDLLEMFIQENIIL